MKGDIYFEEISAGAISPQMPHRKAIIINVGQSRFSTPLLKELYTRQSYKIFIVNTTLAKLRATLQRCNEVGVPAIVNCGKEVPEPDIWHPQEAYNGALVLPGENQSNSSLMRYIAEDPLAASFSIIGYQGYRTDPENILQLQRRYFEDMRLGTIRDDSTLVEPLVRETTLAFIDMRSVRYSDYPYSTDANPNGLYAEEICTIARYIGLSGSLKGLFIYGQECDENALTICNRLISEVIWHLCEGIASNMIEHPDKEGNEEYFQRKIVSLGDNGQSISFTTSCNTGRWWMEMPSKDDKIIFVPCSANDYRMACSGEIPIRWLFFYQKYSL